MIDGLRTGRENEVSRWKLRCEGSVAPKCIRQIACSFTCWLTDEVGTGGRLPVGAPEQFGP